MKTFIIHANQEVVVSSPSHYWPPETLRSKPTFSVEAYNLETALRQIKSEVKKRYENQAQHVESVCISAQLVRELEGEK